jgi:catechol 2,3-dioxygenase-like lactoylglutathione lyase family enzyme
MKARLHVITLAVEDLERALAFYRDGLGFASNGIIGSEWTDERTGANGAVVLFDLDGDLILSLYPRSDLAKDAAISIGPAHSGEFSLGQLVERRDEVDELLGKAEAAGAAVTSAHDRPWGIYSGYFRDPDGHLWEVIWNPGRIPSHPAAAT